MASADFTSGSNMENELLREEKIKRAATILNTTPRMPQFFHQLAQCRDDFCVVVGAGCSMALGVPDFDTMRRWASLIMTRGMQSWTDDDLAAAPLHEFDRLWESSSREMKYQILSQWMSRNTSFLEAYDWLAQLVQAGYFSRFVTYNFDTYLEQALHSVGIEDVIVLVNGKDPVDHITRMTAARGERWILKTHGDHPHRIYALSQREIIEFGEQCRELLTRLTAGPIVVIGYSARDADFIRSLSFAETGGEIWFVNPSPPSAAMQAAMDRRQSGENWLQLGFSTFLMTVFYQLQPVAEKQLQRSRFRVPNHVAEQTVVAAIPGGLHGAPAGRFVALLRRFDSEIRISAKGMTVDGKSVMGVMMLGIEHGSEVTVHVDGSDAQEALAAAVAFFEGDAE